MYFDGEVSVCKYCVCFCVVVIGCLVYWLFVVSCYDELYCVFFGV